jgi:very-short-patch-repair endonuclease
MAGKVRFARHLRRRLTETETLLWEKLRNRHFFGYKFRRQHPLGKWIADFACLERKVVIELDGSYHFFRRKKDAMRDRAMNMEEFIVLRFSNIQVHESMECVLGTIKMALEVDLDASSYRYRTEKYMMQDQSKTPTIRP